MISDDYRPNTQSAEYRRGYESAQAWKATGQRSPTDADYQANPYTQGSQARIDWWEGFKAAFEAAAS